MKDACTKAKGNQEIRV
ncbi:hypothetical protein, partial [Paenibacillus sp. Pae15]